ncbi:RPA-interacting protein [Latimeria chalumnae]|uniref:RPA interacting protein n=1 Tax=Latimeria chalumnae TaxID=7897 RepID=H3BFS6_LATCH|nr:PREDICTED: RPA-interacting protein [Latimeria chalumnae]|eukprot:XP_005988635.1 PREDICTED: RPA-interacting protein [Latimeria chalumnae]
MESMRRHRNLFKNTTPPWRETYRKRCVERLKNSRAKLLEKYRKSGENLHYVVKGSLLVQEVMEEEWKVLQSSNRAFSSLWRQEDCTRVLSMLKDTDELTVLEEIQQELAAQEQSIIEEYERSLQFDEECLNAVIDGLETDRIICPVCNRNNLTVTSHFVCCQCGMYVDAQFQELTEQKLHSLLESSVTEHMEQCPHRPVFSLTSGFDGATSLLLSCQVCDHLSVVL